MTQKVSIERNLVGLEDLLFGTGTATQSRGGKDVTVTKINAQNLPFDESRSLSQAITDLGEYNAYLVQYGQAILDLQANFQAIIETQATQATLDTIDGDISQLTFANSLKLDGQTLEQVRANIDAVSLAGQTLEQVRANINAEQLGGKTLAVLEQQIADDIADSVANVDSLQDTQTAVLGVEIWGNAIRQQGLQFEGVTL